MTLILILAELAVAVEAKRAGFGLVADQVVPALVGHDAAEAARQVVAVDDREAAGFRRDVAEAVLRIAEGCGPRGGDARAAAADVVGRRQARRPPARADRPRRSRPPRDSTGPPDAAATRGCTRCPVRTEDGEPFRHQHHGLAARQFPHRVDRVGDAADRAFGERALEEVALGAARSRPMPSMGARALAAWTFQSEKRRRLLAAFNVFAL